MKALKFSTDQMLISGSEEPPVPENRQRSSGGELSNWAMALNLVLAVAGFVLLFKLFPLLVASSLGAHFPLLNQPVLFSFVDGTTRLAVFLLYILAISFIKDIRRIFQYHGAEHKVVFNHESREPLSIANAQKYPTLHPRCGTSFLMVVMLLSIFVYAFIPFQAFSSKLLSRIVLIPLIAGLSYEIIRYAARKRTWLLSWMTRPGLWLQLITTQEPSDDQLEIAIRALDEALILDNAGGRLAVI
jgi:uncharacterized protein YqhQ